MTKRIYSPRTEKEREADVRLELASLMVARWVLENETLVLAALRAYGTPDAREEALRLSDLLRDWRFATNAVLSITKESTHRGSRA